MPRKNVAAANRIYESRNRGDVDAVLAECDPDVEWHPHLATLSGEPVRGHDGVREYLASLQERASGVDVEVPIAHVLTFERGKCSRFVSYHDRAEALRVAGLEV